MPPLMPWKVGRLAQLSLGQRQRPTCHPLVLHRHRPMEVAQQGETGEFTSCEIKTLFLQPHWSHTCQNVHARCQRCSRCLLYSSSINTRNTERGRHRDPRSSPADDAGPSVSIRNGTDHLFDSTPPIVVMPLVIDARDPISDDRCTGQTSGQGCSRLYCTNQQTTYHQLCHEYICC